MGKEKNEKERKCVKRNNTREREGNELGVGVSAACGFNGSFFDGVMMRAPISKVLMF